MPMSGGQFVRRFQLGGGWRRYALVACVAPALAVAACGVDDGESESAAGGQSAATRLNAKLPETIREEGVVRFAGDPHPPYRLAGAGGKIDDGIDPDLQAALSKVLGVKVERVVVAGLPAALTGMQSGRFDVFNGPVRTNAERQAAFDNIVWMTTRTAYLVPKSSDAGVKSTGDLCGQRVAAVAGSVIEDQLKKLSAWCVENGKAKATLVPLTGTNDTLLAAKAGRADAAGLTEEGGLYAMKQEPDAYSIVVQTEEQGAGTDRLAMLVPKKSGLGPVMFEAFKELFKNGEYARIMKKWGLEKVTVPEPSLNPKVDG